jgi:hypothetical protein
MREAFALALSILERCLLSVVLIFLATIAIGITARIDTSPSTPRTVEIHNVDGAAVAQ